jgi:nitric oxide reductase activation protein
VIAPEQQPIVETPERGIDVILFAAVLALVTLGTIEIFSAPDDKIYWRRHRIQRDVAVVFLLDMSASTAEALNANSYPPQHLSARPATYGNWRHQRQETQHRATRKSIIDVEKESAALLTQVLESIGDTYGIYGFSGYGRDNVEFYVIKDIAERFGEPIKRRIDKIAPMQATRMGAAIRHTISKLEQQSAATKILFLFSDGRPQDREYSRPGAQQEYAVHDTHMALLEAKQKGITPFCLTVDPSGHDYLQAMCGDVGYEVLDEIERLPERLPMLYRALAFPNS